jgi:hypothetical protein
LIAWGVEEASMAIIATVVILGWLAVAIISAIALTKPPEARAGRQLVPIRVQRTVRRQRSE